MPNVRRYWTFQKVGAMIEICHRQTGLGSNQRMLGRVLVHNHERPDIRALNMQFGIDRIRYAFPRKIAADPVSLPEFGEVLEREGDDERLTRDSEV